MYAPGVVLDGKYRVDRQLGAGGMGVVLAAEHLALRTPVALKFLAERYLERPDVVERFLREARATAALRSEHVCRVTDVGRLDSGVPYIVMELLEGRDLSQLLRVAGPLPVATAADLVLQACDAIAEAHALGIIHRDLKPANLFLAQRRDGRSLVKVLDFGVAKSTTSTDPGLTHTSNVVGSPTYMAPEALRSAKAPDPRSDIWALGVILHELVTGRPPFVGTTVADLAIRIATEPLEPIEGSPEMSAVIARALDKNPARRFQTVGELAEALAALVTSASLLAGDETTDVQPVDVRLSNELTTVAAPVTPPPATPTPLTRALQTPPPTTRMSIVTPIALPPGATTLNGASGSVDALPAVRRTWLYAVAGLAAIGLGVSLAVIVSNAMRGGDPEIRAVAAPPLPPQPRPTSTTSTDAPVADASPAIISIDAAIDATIAAEPDAGIDAADDEIQVDPPVDAGRPTPRKKPPHHIGNGSGSGKVDYGASRK